MGIIFNEREQVIHLFNEKLSYIIGINSLGILEHLYFGKRLTSFNRNKYLKYPDHNFQFYVNNEFKVIDSYYENETQVEVGTHLRNDLKPASFIVSQDNDEVTDFRFVSFEIGTVNEYDDYYPHSRNISSDDNKLLIILKDERRDVYLHLYYVLLANENSLIRSSKIINKTKKPINKF